MRFLSWFFSVVILSVLLNIVSDYLRPYVGKYVERVSDTRRVKNAKKREEIREYAELIIRQPERLRLLENSILWAQITMLLGAVFIPISVTTIFSYVSMLASVKSLDTNVLLYSKTMGYERYFMFMSRFLQNNLEFTVIDIARVSALVTYLAFAAFFLIQYRNWRDMLQVRYSYFDQKYPDKNPED